MHSPHVPGSHQSNGYHGDTGGLSLRVMQTGWRNGLTEPYKTQDGKIHLAQTHPRGKQAGGGQAGQQLCRRGAAGPCGQLAKHESAVCPSIDES